MIGPGGVGPLGRRSKDRNRQIGLSLVREPSGRRKRDDRDYAPAQVRRLRDAALKGMADSRWGTELGRLLLTRQIEPMQFAAGERWARLAADYRRAINSPPSLRAAAMERGGPGYEPDPESEAGAAIVRHERVVVRRMERAHLALVGAGKLAEAAVRAVCERDEAAPYAIVYLTEGLSALVRHFRLTEGR